MSGEPPDPCDWIEANFRIYRGREPEKIRLALHQKAILRYALQRVLGSFLFCIIIYSTIKKGGKSTIAGAIGQWFAETVARFASIFCVGNDARQARERSFEFIRQSISAHPDFVPGKDILPGQWECLTNTLRCLKSGSKIEALAVDARGEAGGAPALSIWTELWGFETTEALRFWDELTPVPTLPDSIRLVETYAGYDGESELLHGLYKSGLEGQQLTNDEVARVAARDKDGERYEDFLRAFAETDGDPQALVPIWVNEAMGQFMYWDSGVEARRMSWQQGEEGDKYYQKQEAQLPPKANRRLHGNFWEGAESAYIPLEVWDRLVDPDMPDFKAGDPETGKALDRNGVVLAVDAASTGDCFAVCAVTRHPKRFNEPAIRACKVWAPPKVGEIDYSAVEAYLDMIIDAYNVVEIAYDAYQLTDMMQRFRKKGKVRCRAFNQQQERLVADRQLYDLAMNGGISYAPDLDPAFRQHLANANAKLQKDEASKMRIVKKTAGRPIDLVVAASMGVHRCMKLVMENA